MNKYNEISWNGKRGSYYGYYHDQGFPANLVLVPGSYTHHSIWEPVLASTSISANILLVELPGFGKSLPKEPDGTIEGFTSSILRVIDAAKIDRFFIGGHSIGGMIAIEMIDHAETRLDGIVSCEGWTHYSVEQNAFCGKKNQTLTPEQNAKRSYYGTIGRQAWTDDEIRQYTKIWKKWEKGASLLEKTHAPVLEIWGDRGLHQRPTREQLMIPNNDNITLAWLPNGGHSYLVQYPDEVGELIAQFISNNS